VHGTLTDVTVTTADGRHLGGSLAADDRSWHSDGTLSAGQHYVVRVSADNGDGGRGSTVDSFSTSPAPEALTVELTPGDHAVYGVGEPITAALSLPVHDPAARKVVESGLTVSSSPSVTGSWYWVDDRTLHFRPEGYWPAHAAISASYDLSGRHVDGDVYGGEPSRISFSTGDRMLAYTDAGSDYMTVYRNGESIRSIPITTGKPGFSTRSGIKVVLEQAPVVFMNSSTVGIAADSSDAYHKDVAWDTRVTWSGEYVHAAPWSVGEQGVANVSHGCTGMSTGNAHWFYDTFRRGDLVQVVNSYGHQMEHFGNGYGDWNISWSDWQQGSALHQVVQTSPVSARPETPVGLLRPEA
jgi:lipoprotein-anchoring transpeptidase ErfK/SrfK